MAYLCVRWGGAAYVQCGRMGSTCNRTLLRYYASNTPHRATPPPSTHTRARAYTHTHTERERERARARERGYAAACADTC